TNPCCYPSLAQVPASKHWKNCWEKSSEDLTSMAVEGNREPDQVPVSKFSVSITQTATPPISPAIPPVTNPTSSYLDVPFADFVGRCFLRGCLCADLVESWIRKKQAQADAKIESAAS